MFPDKDTARNLSDRDLAGDFCGLSSKMPFQHFEILRLIAESAAFKAGNVLKDLGGKFVPTVKEDAYVGARAIVTDADLESQRALISVFKSLLEADGNYGFITEEHVDDPSFRSRLISSSELPLLREKTVFIIDELDGTWKHKANHHDWSVSIGCISELASVAGVVYAPKIDGGSLYSAALGCGAVLKTPRGETALQISRISELAQATIGFGIDCAISNKFPLQAELFRTVGNIAGQCDLCGSCALGLALVSAGKLDALVQPPQRVWDWAGGKLLVEEAGGQVILYTQVGNQIERVGSTDTKIDYQLLDPDKRSVGLIAGPKALSEELFELLVRQSTPCAKTGGAS